MTELMKQYEAETGRKATFFQMAIDSEGNETHNELTTLDFDLWATNQAENLERENAKLKAQLRWRPVNERPKKDGKYFVTLEDSLDAGTFENDTIIYTSEAKYVDGKWDIPAGLRFIRWLPIPPAPEGE